ncbi:MAG: murein biosynthesis integral membrane protein MurJ [Clostridia bacterium]|nr:murein biosynthesis integral membrane protein MurJ [Clostridia bacterium]
MGKYGVKKTTFLMMVLSIIIKFIGFLRSSVLAYYYGAGYISDAYNIACDIPILLFAFLGNAIVTAYVPMFTQIEKDEGEKAALKYSNTIITVFSIISFGIILFITVFAEPFVRILAVGFDEKTLELAASFARISSWCLIFITAERLFICYLNIRNNYLLPVMVSLPMNILLILSIAISSKLGYEYLGFGILIALSSQMFFLIPSLIKEKYKFYPCIDIKNKNVIQTVKIVLPVLLGVSVNQINKIIDKSLASTIAVGGISNLNYASVINTAIQDIVIFSIITITFVKISQFVSENRTEELKKMINKAISAILCLIIPISFVVIIFSKEIVTILFMRGSFDKGAMLETSSALICYSVGMVFVSLRDILIKVFYSMKDSKTPIRNSIYAIIINIVLNFILSSFMGISGLALATSISAVSSAVLMYFSLKKKIGKLDERNISFLFIKILVISVIVAAAMYFLYNILLINLGIFISFAITLVFGVLLYIAFAYIFKVEDIKVFLNSFIRKIIR